MTSFPFDPQSIVKLAGEVTDADVAYYNLVLIGGPFANILVRKLVDAGREPDDGSDSSWMAVFGDFKLYSNGFGGSRDVLVVAGPDREETRKAAEELVSGMG
jgi:S-layer protein (TIGR01564 family)